MSRFSLADSKNDIQIHVITMRTKVRKVKQNTENNGRASMNK